MTNYDKLTAAEAEYARLKGEDEADQAAADAVKAKIAKISDPVTLADKDAIEEARAAYEALTENQKAKLSDEDKSKLNEAVGKLADLMKPIEEVADMIAGLPKPEEMTGSNEEILGVKEAEEAFDSLSEEEKALLPAGSEGKLEAAKNALAEINHTSGDVTIDGLPWDIKVVAKEITEGEEYEKMKAYKAGKTLTAMYDIKLIKVVKTPTGVEEETYQLNGTEVTVTIKNENFIGHENPVAIHQMGDQESGISYEELAATFDGNTARFKINSFSNVGIAADPIAEQVKPDPKDPTESGKTETGKKVPATKPGTTKTGDTFNLYGWIIIMLLAATAAGWAIVYRRKVGRY